MPLHTLRKLLNATDELKALQARARGIMELQQLYSRSAPSALAASSRVKAYRAGTLVIAADNSAVAAKLKQLTPRLLLSIQKVEKSVTALRIEVRVTVLDALSKSTKSSLSPHALEEFDALADRVKDGALKSALSNLVRRHAKFRTR